MKLKFCSLKIVILIAAASSCAPFLLAQASVPAADTPSKSIQQAVTRFEDNLMALAQAMPAEKYNFAPAKDTFAAGSPAEFATVRTFAQELTHVAAEPFRMLAPFGVTPDPGPDPKTFESLTAKEDILKALQASFDYQNKVIATITPANALTPAGPRGMTPVSALIAILNDDGDHYGQMVEYLRMNGLIPPATVRQQERMKRQPAAK